MTAITADPRRVMPDAVAAPEVDGRLLRAEVAALRTELAELGAELDGRDVEETTALENAVEFVASECRTLRYVLVAAVKGVWGDCELHQMLHPVERSHPGGVWRGAPVMSLRRPERRWRQYGTKHQLGEIAEAHDVKLFARSNRVSMILRLWRAGALPGSVHREHDKAACPTCSSS